MISGSRQAPDPGGCYEKATWIDLPAIYCLGECGVHSPESGGSFCTGSPAPVACPDRSPATGLDANADCHADTYADDGTTGCLLASAQLDSLVAPLALYPDPLLSQVLVASTYPLEIVEAEQWVQQNPNLKGAAIQDAVKQQNWDPSIQALTAFPDVLKELSGNIQWTTQLGNAFLAQQPAVMDAVQRLRGGSIVRQTQFDAGRVIVPLQARGTRRRLRYSPQTSGSLVPDYDPMAIWGPPAFYPYPVMSYPYYPYIGFGSGIMVGAFFGGFGGWYGWGWHPNWFGRSIIVNNGFFSRYGYGRGLVAGGVWAHDPAHRMGVPYANRQVASRFRASAGS